MGAETGLDRHRQGALAGGRQSWSPRCCAYVTVSAPQSCAPRGDMPFMTLSQPDTEDVPSVGKRNDFSPVSCHARGSHVSTVLLGPVGPTCAAAL